VTEFASETCTTLDSTCRWFLHPLRMPWWRSTAIRRRRCDQRGFPAARGTPGAPRMLHQRHGVVRLDRLSPTASCSRRRPAARASPPIFLTGPSSRSSRISWPLTPYQRVPSLYLARRCFCLRSASSSAPILRALRALPFLSSPTFPAVREVGRSRFRRSQLSSQSAVRTRRRISTSGC